MAPSSCFARIGGIALVLLAALPLRTEQAGIAAPAAITGRTGTTLTLTAPDAGQTVVLRRGETLRVVLSANAGTGYSWDVERMEGDLLQPQGVEIRQAPGLPQPDGRVAPLAGGPQQVTFVFRAVAAGRGSLRLKLWRPWEGEASIVERFGVPLVVVKP